MYCNRLSRRSWLVYDSKRPRQLRRKPRAGPLYDGWLMRSPAGVSMCRLSRGRAEWYVKRGLAKYADGGAHEVTLTFEPNGLGNSAEPWLLAPKDNACVGCGVEQACASDGLMRWSVVPPSFRSLLPEAHKSRAQRLKPAIEALERALAAETV